MTTPLIRPAAPTPLTVLVDMDGVLAQWSQQYVTEFRAHAPHLTCVDADKQTSFSVFAGLNEEEAEAALWVMNKPGFYADLPPIEGGAGALNRMLDQGFDVAICTSPWLTNLSCIPEKLEWLERHIGKGWAARAVVTRDKTRVRGDILIDDKDIIIGMQTPTWEHVLFTQPYNAHVTDRRRMSTWDDLDGILTSRSPLNI